MIGPGDLQGGYVTGINIGEGRIVGVFLGPAKILPAAVVSVFAGMSGRQEFHQGGYPEGQEYSR